MDNILLEGFDSYTARSWSWSYAYGVLRFAAQEFLDGHSDWAAFNEIFTQVQSVEQHHFQRLAEGLPAARTLDDLYAAEDQALPGAPDQDQGEEGTSPVEQ